MSKQSHPILTLTMQVLGIGIANKFVNAHGTPASAGEPAIGVVLTEPDTGNIDNLAPVVVLGTAVVRTDTAIIRGQAVASSVNGYAKTLNGGDVKVGIALQSAGANEFVEVLLTPSA